VIWSQIMTDKEQKYYTSYCRRMVNEKTKPCDIHDFYQALFPSGHKNHLPVDLPPKDPEWQPAPPSTAVSDRSGAAAVNGTLTLQTGKRKRPVPVLVSPASHLHRDPGSPSPRLPAPRGLDTPTTPQRPRSLTSMFFSSEPGDDPVSPSKPTEAAVARLDTGDHTPIRNTNTLLEASLPPTSPSREFNVSSRKRQKVSGALPGSGQRRTDIRESMVTVERLTSEVIPEFSEIPIPTPEFTRRNPAPIRQSPAPSVSASSALSDEACQEAVQTEHHTWAEHVATAATRPRRVHSTPLSPSDSDDPDDPDDKAVKVILQKTIQELRSLPSVALQSRDFVEFHALRMQLWLALRVVTFLVARAFLRHVASLCDRDPGFLRLPNQDFGAPFPALTYAAVTRLLGEPPVVVAPRRSMPWSEDVVNWQQCVQMLFDFDTEDRWANAAPFHVQLRDWREQFELEGVDIGLLELWRHDLGYLMRPAVWIVPSWETKTLFRLDPKPRRHKRCRTRWFLPGQVVPSSNKVVTVLQNRDSGMLFRVFPNEASTAAKVSPGMHKRIDPFRFAQGYLDRYAKLAPGDIDARANLEKDTRKRLDFFECPDVDWGHERIPTKYGRRWVPFWANGEEFPLGHMKSLSRRLVHYSKEQMDGNDAGTQARGEVDDAGERGAHWGCRGDGDA
jgi:hypothetical protein